MSLSSLIKREEGEVYKIESFEAEDIARHFPQEESSETKGAEVRLPIGDNSSHAIHLTNLNQARPDPEQDESFKEKIARLERDAYEKGFEQGRKDGLALEKRQMDERGKQLDAVLGGLNSLKGQIFTEAEGDMLKLSMLIAKKIIREEVKTDSKIIIETIQAASKFVADKSNIRIRLNPADMEEVRELLPDLSAMAKGGRFQLIEDHVIERGGCILETGFGKVNATIEDQLWMLEKEIERLFGSCSVDSDAPVT